MNFKVFSEMKLSAKRKIGIWIVLAIVLYVQFDMLISLLIEFLHTSFELFEFSLDKLVEHIFHTDLHTTQRITFYLMLLIAALILYKLGCLVPIWFFTIKNNLADICHQLIEEFLSYWRTTSAINKMKWWTVLTVCSGMLMWGLLS